MKKAILMIFALGLFMSSCSVTRKTYTVQNIAPTVQQYPTVADLQVGDKMEKTAEWRFSPFDYKMDNRKIRTENLIADMIKESGVDVLIKPEVVYTKESFGRRSVTVSGYPAKFSNIRRASTADLDTLKADTLEEKRMYILGEDNETEHLQVTNLEKRKTRFVVRAGYGVNSKMVGGHDYSSYPGYTVGVEALTQINSNMYWNIGAVFASRGFRKSNRYDSYDCARVHTFEIPFGVGGKWSLGRYLSFDLHGGLFLSCDMAGFVEDDSELDFIEDIDGYSRMDVGCMLGAGLWLHNFNLDFTYHPGFVVFSEDGVQNTLWIRIGYAF